MLQPRVRLSAISSRGFAPGWELLLPDADRLALNTSPEHGGGNAAIVKMLPKVGTWLADTNPDWIHAHYLTSHGTLAWAAKLGWRLRAQIAGSAWGSDILVTPNRGGAWRWLTKKALRSCAITTSDSAYMFAAGIGCSVHYVPLHQHPYWRDRYGLTPEQFPQSQKVFERTVSLPLYTAMSDADVERVITAVRGLLA